MAKYQTPADAAEAAVRAFLVRLGEHYLGRAFNISSGKGATDWARIKIGTFQNSCAYCGTEGKLDIDYLDRFGAHEFGLHHPGNIVPCCSICLKRDKDKKSRFVGWETHLKTVCERFKQEGKLKDRHKRIKTHRENEEFPALNDKEKHAIRVIAETLHRNIKMETEKSLAMYRELDKELSKDRK